jgi:hypothetical protein
MVVINILLYPVVYVKDITAIAHFNFLGFASAVYVIIVLGIQMPEYDRYLDFEWKNVL